MLASMDTMPPEAGDKYDFLRFTWSDIHGHARGKTVPRSSVASLWNRGIHVFSGNVLLSPHCALPELPGIHPHGWGNVLACPISATLVPVPWVGGPGFSVGQVLAECRPDTEPTVCTRSMARQQLERLQQEFHLQPYSGFETEFQILNKDTMQFADNSVRMLSQLALSDYEDFLFRMQSRMETAGIQTESMHLEYGPSQVEMALAPSHGIDPMDQYFRFKHAVKEMSKQEGYLATFMTRPFHGDGCANAAHYNISLHDMYGNNVFYDDQAEDKMSSVFRHWMAGILLHSPAITALCSPTVNCYRRLHTKLAPHQADWTVDRRTTCHRVKTLSAATTYMELRLVSAAANPYLVGAGVLAAGMDGLRKKLALQPAGVCVDYPVLPTTLPEALTLLEQDTVLTEQLGSRFMTWFCCAKRQCEIDVLNSSGPDQLDLLARERELYLEFI